MMYGNRFGYNGYENCLTYGGGFMHSGWGILTGGVLIILAVIAIYFLVKRSSQRQINQSALDELKLKFVKGEISEEDYLRRKNFLK